ncbi:hypothetical protein AVEN_107531-1 [Araneus ventricosus]|uniref:Uncharacterized protein n=1 Tax=Araneus ventricosus TaxID=182803 RepID=A0A4Y2X4Q2_ARAVE|nr:hypothetical protein AVEN_107531-1 [Araneus ventricosus]
MTFVHRTPPIWFRESKGWMEGETAMTYVPPDLNSLGFRVYKDGLEKKPAMTRPTEFTHWLQSLPRMDGWRNLIQMHVH